MTHEGRLKTALGVGIVSILVDISVSRGYLLLESRTRHGQPIVGLVLFLERLR